MSKSLQYQLYSKIYFHSATQLVKDFFEWVNSSIYVEKRSCITTYNRTVLLYISADSVPQLLTHSAYIRVTVFVIFYRIIFIWRTRSDYK